MFDALRLLGDQTAQNSFGPALVQRCDDVQDFHRRLLTQQNLSSRSKLQGDVAGSMGMRP